MNSKLVRDACVLLIVMGFVRTVSADDSVELTAMLNEFLAGASVNDTAAHDRFWAEDLIYTTSGGERINKADIMREVTAASESGGDEPAPVYTAEEIRIHQYGDTAVVAFTLVATPTGDGGQGVTHAKVQRYYNTGTFLKRDGQWRVVAWQATRIPPAEQE